MRARRGVAYALLALLVVAHLDLWWWNDGRLLAGLPIGLAYHLAYCVAAAAVMALLSAWAWPEPGSEPAGSPRERRDEAPAGDPGS